MEMNNLAMPAQYAVLDENEMTYTCGGIDSALLYKIGSAVAQDVGTLLGFGIGLAIATYATPVVIDTLRAARTAYQKSNNLIDALSAAISSQTEPLPKIISVVSVVGGLLAAPPVGVAALILETIL